MAFITIGTNSFSDTQYAALSGKVENLRRKLEDGGHINALGKVGLTPLQVACTTSNEDIIDTILDFKPDMNIKSTCNNTALNMFLELFLPNHRLLKRFLDEGANPNIPNPHGRSALHLTVSRVKMVSEIIEEYIKLLLQYGANVHLEDNDGYTPLHLAILNGIHGAVVILLKSGAYINNENLEGYTEIDLAILYKNDYPRVMQQMGEHIIIQHVSKKLVEPEYVEVVCEYEEFSKFREKCNLELEKMKNITVGDTSVTYHTIFSLSPTALAKKIRNPDIIKSFCKFDRKLFPILGEGMFENFRATLRRLKAIEIGHTFLRKIEPNIPQVCLDSIDSYLTNKDFEKLKSLSKD